MAGKLKKAIIPIAVFLLAAFAFRLLWDIVETDFLNRVGYWFWTMSSAEDLVNARRIMLLADFCEQVLPIAFGLVAMGWMAVYMRRKQRSREGAG